MVEDRFGILGKVVAGTYLVEEVIAESAFSVVYRAEHRGFRVRVALKCLKVPAEPSVDGARLLEQLRRETEPSFRLAAVSPAIARPLHVDVVQSGGQSGGSSGGQSAGSGPGSGAGSGPGSGPGLGGAQLVPLIVLEWLEGWTLDVIVAQRVAQGRPPIGLRKLVRMLTPVARALEQAHALSVPPGTSPLIHRGLEPKKLFVAFIGGEQVVKILGLGVRGSMGSARRAPVGGEALAGGVSPAYAAPEQWAPDRYGATGTWTDVWGLALTLVEAIRGGRVFDGEPPALRRAILDPAQRPTPRTRGVRVSDDVEAIFERALALDPRTRFVTVRSFWDQLLEALDLDSNGNPRWSRREDPRAEKHEGRGVDGYGVEGRADETVGAAPRLTGLPPPGPSNLAVDWDALRESQPPPPPRAPLGSRRRRWQPPPALDALEFEPPSRSELPPVLGAAPSSGNMPVVPPLDIPGAPPLPGDLKRSGVAAVGSAPGELDDLPLESLLESTAPPAPRPDRRPSPSAPPRASSHPSIHPSAPPPPRTSVHPSFRPPLHAPGPSPGELASHGRPSALGASPDASVAISTGAPPRRSTLPPGSPSARPGNVLLEPLDEGKGANGDDRRVASLAPPGANQRSSRPSLAPSPGPSPSRLPPPASGSQFPSQPAPSLRAPSQRPTSRPPASTRRSTVDWGRLTGAGVLLVGAVLIAARNQAHAAASGGESLSWGPLPALWISLGLFGVAVVLAAASVLGRSE